MRGEGFIGLLHPLDGLIDCRETALQIDRIRLDEQPHQSAPHDSQRDAPGLVLGVGRVNRQQRLFMAQLDNGVADFQHHEHPAQQLALNQRFANRQAVRLMHQVAGLALEA